MKKVKAISITFVIIILLGGIVVAGLYISQYQRNKKIMHHLTTAEQALENDNLTEARSHLEIIVDSYGDSMVAPRACYLLTKTSYQCDDMDAVGEYSDLFLAKYPDNEHREQVRFYRAVYLLRSRGDIDEAEDIFTEIENNSNDETLVSRARFGLANIMAERGRLKNAKKTLDELHDSDSLPDDVKQEVETLLGEINVELLFSPQVVEGDEIYTVKKGDALYNIARKYDVTQDLIMKCNNITNPRMLKVGKKLKIPRADFEIVVNKTTNEIILKSGGEFFKKYRVRTGKYDYLTPTGNFKIEYKKKDPEWVDPRTHKRYPPNDPANELGTRWMAFQGSALGIHGTIHPDTIGEYASRGCVGMLMEDVEELYDIVPEGTPVIIKGSIQNERQSS